MEIQIVDHAISMDEVKKMAEFWYGTMIKGCVDVEKGRVALGGDYHIESSELLTSTGSVFQDVWGFNIRFEEDPEGTLEFDSMVNLKPNLNNRTRSIEDAIVLDKATDIIRSFVQFKTI